MESKNLSFPGRVTLAKSVMEAVPIYPMMTNRLPQSCIDEIEKLERNFIWGDNAHIRRVHAVRWDVVTMPKFMGGLGLRKLRPMNEACLLKLAWRLFSGSTDFWCTVVKGKYVARLHNNTIVDAKVADSSLWKALKNVSSVLTANEYWVVGNGKHINAWTDCWLEPGLRISDLNISIPDHLTQAKVSDLLNDGGDWNLDLLNDWLPVGIRNKLLVAAVSLNDEDNDFRA
jgi:hypothetical protein